MLTGCPGDITVNNLPGEGFAPATWAEPNATDANSVPTVESNYVSGSLFPIGETMVTYTATDNLGSQAMCSFTVTVLGESSVVVLRLNIKQDTRCRVLHS